MSLSSDHKFVVDGDFINFQKGFGAGERSIHSRLSL